MQVIITTWKNITNQVVNLHAIQSQNISKSTGNISKNTSKSCQVKPTTGGIRPSLVEILDFQGLVREVFGGFQGSHGGLGRRCAASQRQREPPGPLLRTSPHCIEGLLMGRSLPIFTDLYRFFGLSSFSLPSFFPGVLFTLATCLHGYMFFFQKSSSGGIR